MNILQDYLEMNAAKDIIDFRFRANPVDGAVHIYIHPIGKDGETLDFYVSGNALIDKQLADKISVNPGEAVSAMNIIAGARSNVMFYDAAKRKLDEALAEIVQNRDRISWLEQQREVECQQKEAALAESAGCLAESERLMVIATELRAEVVRLTEDRAKWRKCAGALALRVDNMGCTLSYEDAKALIEFDRLVEGESERIK